MTAYQHGKNTRYPGDASHPELLNGITVDGFYKILITDTHSPGAGVA
jgi:hypothetical protein